MEKSVSFTHEEATALLEMSLCTTALDTDETSNNALSKLADLCREFALEEQECECELCACESHG